MKILTISNMFPPYIMGGAEMAAHSQATLLAAAGHEVHVLTCAPTPEVQGTEILGERLTVERRFFKNVFQIYQADRDRTFSKVIWHANDHFHATTERICGEVMDQFQPDVVSTHDLQGIGYNLLKAIGEHRLPCVQTLHDFGFMCISMNRFRGGRECTRYHWTCQASAALKRFYFDHIEALSFISPSAALLDRYRPYLPKHLEAVVIPLPLLFDKQAANAAARPAPTADHVLQLLYVGQVEKWKGVDFVLEVLAGLAAQHRFHLRIVGGGSLLEGLRARYGAAEWLTLAGKVSAAEVGVYMTASDLLLVPSIWFENAPLVISQAQRLGLPVLASRTGGLPEMVQAGINGELLPVGDHAAWGAMLARITQDPAMVQHWREQAGRQARLATPQELTDRVVDVFKRTAAHLKASVKPAALAVTATPG